MLFGLKIKWNHIENEFSRSSLFLYALFLPFQFYCAEYAFSARNTNEVSLFEGQVVSVISKEDLDGNTEWWWVDADGQQGFAPAAYLSRMEEKTGWPHALTR